MPLWASPETDPSRGRGDRAASGGPARRVGSLPQGPKGAPNRDILSLVDEQTKRVIVVFPQRSARVERFRSEFDPIAASIPAHITLVYPTAMTLARAREAMEHAAEQ